MSTNAGTPGFAHRACSDGTFDAICLKCYRTIARAQSESELAAGEANHRCDPKDLREAEGKRPAGSASTNTNTASFLL